MDSKMRGVVRCEAFNPQWKSEFERVKAMLLNFIGDLVICIEHVGSTSVEGLSAKPIIDIDIVFDSYAIFPMIIARLNNIGFIHEGNGGISGRETFKRNYEDEYMPYHLYACPKDSEELLRHISFREYLRGNEADRHAYGELKMKLAKLFPNDIDSYIAGKHDFIQHLYQQIKNNGMLMEGYLKIFM